MNNKILKYNAIFLFLFSFIGVGIFLIYDFISRETKNIIIIEKKINIDSKNFNTAEEALINNGLGKDYSLNYYPDFATNIIDFKKDTLPINGISNIKTYYCNEQGFLSNYFSDRHGFPNNDDVFETKKLDIALIGDSYLDGACTNKSSIQQNLSKQNKNLKIATFAQGGAGPLLSLALLKEYASEYKPNYVFWFWVGNDLRNLQDELQSPLRFYMREGYSQNLINPKNKSNADESVKKILKVYQQFNNQEDFNKLNKLSKKNYKKDLFTDTKNLIKNYFPRTFALIKKLRKEKKYSNYKERQTPRNMIISRREILVRRLPHKEDLLMAKASKEILEEAKNYIESKGGELVMIYLGWGGWNSKEYIDKVKYEKTHNLQKNLVRDFSIKNKIRFYNLDKDIDKLFKSGDHIDGHFSDYGYKMVSNIISRYIEEIYSK